MKKITIALSIIAILFGCSKNPVATTTGTHESWPKISAGTAVSYSHHIRAELLSKDSIHEGYDSLAVVLRDSATGTILTNASAQWFPLMDMGMMKHSSPVDNYGETTGSDSLFRNGILFVMASDTSLVNGGWTLRLRIHDYRYTSTDTFNDSIDFNPWVKSESSPSTIWWKAPDSLWRVAALISPKKPASGTNDLELFIGRKATALSWPVDSTWTVSFIPTMPSMGHSSPNNIDPIQTGNGHYKGKVNFTMSGDWRLTFTFAQTGGSFTAADTNQYIDVNVK